MPKLKIPQPLEFEWDQHNQDKNWLKHKVDYRESEEVFANKPYYSYKDRLHSRKEPRYTILGFTKSKRYLYLTFTLRAGKIRIISARDMDKKERRLYEQKTK